MRISTVLLIAWAASLLLALPSLSQPSVDPDFDLDFDLDALRVEREEKQARYMLRTLTQKRHQAASEFMEEEKFAEARTKLERLNPERLNPYERALTYRMLANVSLGLEDPESALRYFELVVDQEVLLIDDEASVRFFIAQIQASLEQWEQVDETLRQWFRYVEKPNGRAYYYLAISRYQRDMYEEALVPALKSLEVSKEPSERWLQLVAALHLQKEDFANATPILEELVTRFSKKQYWVQLSIIYAAGAEYQSALRVQQLAYEQGLLTTNDDLLRLVRTYLFHELPYPAARILERGLEEGVINPDGAVFELLGNSWIAAREYENSIEPLQRAADLAQDGRLYLRLGQVRVQREDWKEATALIEKAIAKGGLLEIGRAQMLLGISYFGDDHPESARRAFRRASKHDSTRVEAIAWLEHIARQSGDG
jgi:tetratricopeptide (TPR) repeat protein